MTDVGQIIESSGCSKVCEGRIWEIHTRVRVQAKQTCVFRRHGGRYDRRGVMDAQLTD